MDRNSFGFDCVRRANLHGSSAWQMLGDGGADQPFNNAKEQVPISQQTFRFFLPRTESSQAH